MSALVYLLPLPSSLLTCPGGEGACVGGGYGKRPEGAGEMSGQPITFSVPTVASPGSDFQFVDFFTRI